MNAYEDFKSSLAIYALGVIGSFLIVGGLIWAMYHYTHPAPITQNRIMERKKALTEIRMGEAEALNTYGWVDQTKGVVRLPISRAIELTLQQCDKSQAAFRSNIVAAANKVATPISYE